MRILYHLPLSPYSRKVRLVLTEKRIPFELQMEKVWQRRPEYLDLNPACQVPTLVEENGLAVPDSGVICEYLEEAYPNTTPLLPRTMPERVEARRLVAWFDSKFAQEVTVNLLREKFMKRLLGGGNPDATALRAGYTNLRYHLEYIGWLAETRRWLAGDELTLADFAAAGHLSALDFASDVDWSMSEAARDWYAKIKSRPSFRSLLQDQVPGVTPPPHYADLDF
jgi:glutathione S-transferase